MSKDTSRTLVDERTANNPATGGIAPNSAEARARGALEERFGRKFSEAEWRLYRTRLVAYVRRLQEWGTRRIVANSFCWRSSTMLG